MKTLIAEALRPFELTARYINAPTTNPPLPSTP